MSKKKHIKYFRNNLENVKSESLKLFDNKIFVYSTGFFALTLILLNLFGLRFEIIVAKPLLYTVWIINTLIILLNTSTHLLMYTLHDKTINEIDSGNYSRDNAIKRNKLAMIINKSLLLAVLTITLLYIIFLIINLSCL